MERTWGKRLWGIKRRAVRRGRQPLHGLAEEVFELDAGRGFGVAIFDDHSAREGESPLFAGGMRNGTGAGDDDGVFRNDEREIIDGGIDGVADEVVDGDGTIEDGASS